MFPSVRTVSLFVSPKGRKHVPHAPRVYLALPFRMAVFPFNKLLPVSKWLVLSPLPSEGTGTGCNECEEVFIMNRISLLFTQTLLAAQGRQADHFAIKCN